MARTGAGKSPVTTGLSGRDRSLWLSEKRVNPSSCPGGHTTSGLGRGSRPVKTRVNGTLSARIARNVGDSASLQKSRTRASSPDGSSRSCETERRCRPRRAAALSRRCSGPLHLPSGAEDRTSGDTAAYTNARAVSSCVIGQWQSFSFASSTRGSRRHDAVAASAKEQQQPWHAGGQPSRSDCQLFVRVRP